MIGGIEHGAVRKACDLFRVSDGLWCCVPIFLFKDKINNWIEKSGIKKNIVGFFFQVIGVFFQLVQNKEGKGLDSMLGAIEAVLQPYEDELNARGTTFFGGKSKEKHLPPKEI